MQVFRTVRSGNYRMPKDEMKAFVSREQPLQKLVRILKCDDGRFGRDKSFFVIAGMVLVLLCGCHNH